MLKTYRKMSREEIKAIDKEIAAKEYLLKQQKKTMRESVTDLKSFSSTLKRNL